MIAVSKSKPKTTTAAKLVPAVGYIRMSTEKQDASPAQQRAEVEKMAKDRGYSIIRWYEDLAISGAETSKRRQFTTMIRDAEQRGDFKAIVCWDQDRFGRFDSIDAGEWVAPLRRAGVKLVTVAQGEIDWTSFAGRVIYGIQQEGKNQYLHDLSRNVLRGQVAKAKAGQWANGIAYGYDRQFINERGEHVYRAKLGDNSRKPKNWSAVLVPAEDAQAVATVRWLFDTYASRDVSVRWLTGELNRRGVPTPRRKGNGKWTHYVVGYMLRNRTYLGELSYGRTPHGKFHAVDEQGEIVTAGKWESRRTAPIVTVDAHEPLIDRKTFDKVQRKLDAREKSDRRPRTESNFLLSGIARCGMCGGPLSGTHNNPRGKVYRYYVCGQHCTRRHCIPYHVDATVLERKLVDLLQEKLLNDAEMARLAEIVNRKAGERTTGHASGKSDAARQIAKLEQQIARGTENLLLANPADVPAASKLLDAWRRQRDELAAEIDAEPTRGADPATAARKALEAATQLREQLKDSDPAMVRGALAAVFSKVTIWVQTIGRRHWVTRGFAEFQAVGILAGCFRRSGNRPLA